ncbi:MAG: tRNA pseudouridine(55) synthase TruB, partial [Chloroflexi bacterium RBG_16_57_9]
MKEIPKSGILNIDKPAGMTSHDVVAAVRRAAQEQRVGHAGTLDPMATGVLLVCIGSATRIIEHLQAHPKTYRADIRLGMATDTYDAEGQVTYESPSFNVDRDQVEEALAGFRGIIQQVPPMYSALKRDGRPLYELARAGIEVEREPRTVEIFRLEITHWAPPVVQVEVQCSKGTYIRSLAHDLGQKLGVGGHLSGLVRLASGRFTLDRAESLTSVEDSFKNDFWMYLLHPLDEA